MVLGGISCVCGNANCRVSTISIMIASLCLINARSSVRSRIISVSIGARVGDGSTAAIGIVSNHGFKRWG